MKNPDPLKELPRSIFWVARYISPLTVLHIMSWKKRGKETRSVTAQHAGCLRNYHCLFREHFASRQDFLDTIKPGKSYIYVEQRHWLKHFMWLFQYKAFGFTLGWIPYLAEKYACRNGYEQYYDDESPARKNWDWRFWQWVSRKYMRISTLNYFGNWRRDWVFVVPVPKIEMPLKRKRTK